MRPSVVLLLVLLAIVAFATYFFVTRTPEGGPVAVGPNPIEKPAAPAQKAVDLGRVEAQQPAKPVAVAETDDDENDVGNGAKLSNSLSGVVVDEKNQPVANAKVTLSRDALMGEAISIQWFTGKEASGVPALTTNTDEKGRYVFRGIEPSREYFLMADHPDFSQIQEDLVAVSKSGESHAPDLVLRAGSHLSGTVVDVNGEPIGKARLDLDSAFMMSVESASPDRLTTYTDAGGHYEFKSVADGQRNLTCSAEGYGLQVHHNKAFKGDPTEQLEDNFQLTIGHPIGGRVFGPDNEGIKGCKITALNYGNNTSSRGEAITDDNGDFLINGLEAGMYILMLDAKGYRQARQNRVQADEVSQQIEMIRQGKLTGHVFDIASNQPIKNFHCALLRVNSQTQGQQAMYETTQVKEKFDAVADGSFTLIGVDAGTYALKVMAKDYAARMTDNFVVVDGQQMPPISVGLSQGGSIRGRVVDSSGAPVSGAVVSSKDAEYEEGFEDFVDGLVATRTTVRKGKTNADGIFEIKLLNPGRYKVQIDHPSFTTEFVKNLIVTESKQTDAGQTTLKGGGTVSGRVTDQAGKPLSRGTVRLYNAAGKTYQGRTDTEGRYTIEHVPPGPYTLGAMPTAASGDPFGALVDQQATEIQVTVTEGQISNRDINLGN
jgi:protocatechuate 3,4-dioxygenase beta subunit